MAEEEDLAATADTPQVDCVVSALLERVTEHGGGAGGERAATASAFRVTTSWRTGRRTTTRCEARRAATRHEEAGGEMGGG